MANFPALGMWPHPHTVCLCMCHWTEYKLSVLQVRISEENILDATTQQFITAKISGWALKQGSKHTRHYAIAIFNCKMNCTNVLSNTSSEAQKVFSWTVWLTLTHTDSHPSLHDRILLNYTRIENAHKVPKQTFDFLLCIEVQQFFFLFTCWDIIKCLNASILTTDVFDLVQQFYHATEIGRPTVANLISTCADIP